MDDTWPKEEIAPGAFADVDPATLGPSETESRASNLMACALWAELHEKAGEGVLPEKLPKAAADLLRGLMLDKFRADIAQAPAPVRVKPWTYCPECGETETHYEQGDHKQCAKCYQEWFADIDYSEVVRGNLNRLFLAALEAPDAGVVAELVEALRWIEQHAAVSHRKNIQSVAAAALAKWDAK